MHFSIYFYQNYYQTVSPISLQINKHFLKINVRNYNSWSSVCILLFQLSWSIFDQFLSNVKLKNMIFGGQIVQQRKHINFTVGLPFCEYVEKGKFCVNKRRLRNKKMLFLSKVILLREEVRSSKGFLNNRGSDLEIYAVFLVRLKRNYSKIALIIWLCYSLVYISYRF